MNQMNPEQLNIPAHEMEAITTEVQRHLEQPETNNLSGQEIVKRSIQNYTGTQGVPTPPPTPNDSALPNYMTSAAPADKREVEHLIAMVFKDGIMAANDEAAKSSPFVLDAFHDALAGKLYDELKQRGIVD